MRRFVRRRRAAGVAVTVLVVVAFGTFRLTREAFRGRGKPDRAVLVAVASNFSGPAAEIAERFRRETSYRAVLSAGSTGLLYAQITSGAPFEAYLAADAERPRRLEATGLAVPGTRFTYAVGRLALWSPRAGVVDSRGDVLGEGSWRRLALAHPDLAPYGRAAREVLAARGLWEAAQPRLVRGENVAQAFQFVRTGNAEIGFVAASQAAGAGGSSWAVPPSLHGPIEQQAVLLADRRAARAFLDYLRGTEARAIIRRSGYGLPG